LRAFFFYKDIIILLMCFTLIGN